MGAFDLTQFNADGSVNSSFGVDGSVDATAQVIAQLPALDLAPRFSDGEFLQLMLDGQGRMMLIGVGGSLQGDQDELIMARFNGDGSLDNDFRQRRHAGNTNRKWAKHRSRRRRARS